MASWIQSNAVLTADSKKKLLASSTKKRKSAGSRYVVVGRWIAARHRGTHRRVAASKVTGRHPPSRVTHPLLVALSILPSIRGIHAANSTTLSLFEEAPTSTISLEEFERFAIDRMQVLRGINDLKTVQNLKGDELDREIMQLVNLYLTADTKESSIRKDNASHWVVRLAHCMTEEKRRWFLTMECELFRARFKELPSIEQKEFIMDNDEFSSVEATSVRDFDDVQADLKATILSYTNSMAQANSSVTGPDAFYRVRFEEVADLVAMRRVFVKDGFAYVSKEQLGSLVMAPFRSHLSKQLAVLSRKWVSFCDGPEKDRLVPLVQGLADRDLGPDYGSGAAAKSGEQVSAAMLPTLAKESFPLCMSVMMDALKRTHHLKHQGRQQLGLFLKGIGLPLEEAMRFWRTEMAAVAPGDAFDKQYAYNIRHNYGKEGKRADYTPHSCIKVISGIPGPGQVHGCPFRVLSEEDLRTSLGKLSLADPMRIEQAVTKAKEGHYQLACGKVWEGQHGCACDGINHPNQYYEQSRKVLVGEAEEEKVAKVAKVEAANP